MKSPFLALVVLIGSILMSSCSTAPGAKSTSTTGSTDVVYVSTNGSDSNGGFSASAPVGTLNKAIDLAVVSNANRILVSGNYSLSTNTNSTNAGWYVAGVSNLTISGGWSSDFSSQSDISVLSGGGNCGHAVALDLSVNVVLTNFALTGGAGDMGAGLSVWRSTGIGIFCVISNNTASIAGGGTFLLNCTNCVVESFFSNNTASGNGGSLGISGSESNTVLSAVYGSSANNGGGVYFSGGRYNTFNGVVTGCTANYGGGIYNQDSFDTFNGDVYGCTASYGNGVYNSFGNNNSFLGNVSYNSFLATADGRGGGIFNDGGASNTFGGIVSHNQALKRGNGIYDNGSYNNYTGVVSDNYGCDVGGGGIYLNNCHSITISGAITNNYPFVGYGSCYGDGGGIYVDGGTNIIIASNAVIQYNYCGASTGYHGAGIFANSTGIVTMMSGVVCTNNYRYGAGSEENFYNVP